MATPLHQPAVKSAERQSPALPVSSTSSFVRRMGLIVLLIAGLILATYAYAWWNAYQLSNRFYQDAQTSYEQGEYLLALTGYEEFDEERNEYVQYGGFVQVQRIWSHPNAWPVPDLPREAGERVNEIVYQRLTIEQAETFIRRNMGRPTPYFAEIYLRLGELYEAEGDMLAAREIYEDVISLFPNRPDLVEQAQAHLQRLEG